MNNTVTVSWMTVHITHRQFVFVTFTNVFPIELITAFHTTDQKN